MEASENLSSFSLNESEIRGAKLTKDIEKLTKSEAVRWLKCRSCRNLSELTLKELKTKIRVYIKEGWDQQFLVDPEGKVAEKKRYQAKDEVQKFHEKLLDGKEVPMNSWTQSIDEVPPITHSVVENFFKKTNDRRHLTEGYAFSTTKKFETSGKPMQINFNLPGNTFLLEGYTRPAMRQAKGFSSGQGLYRCSILFDKQSGEILDARDHSCPAGKRGMCKHIAALAYKLVQTKMSGQSHLPRPLSCTDIRQQWGVPSLKAYQDPEKEVLKREPLQNISFQKHVLNPEDHVLPSRKRKLPNEVMLSYTSRPRGEPLVDQQRVKEFQEDLKKCVPVPLAANYISLCIKHTENEENVEEPPQRSQAWFDQRIGKVTGSKAPAVVGLYGKKEFTDTWGCILRKQQEPPKYNKNFARGTVYESSAADAFANDAGVQLTTPAFIPLPSSEMYGASPDRVFPGDKCNRLYEVETGNSISLPPKCLLEIKTRAEGQTKPLSAVTGAHICQVNLQLECTSANVAILQSFVPETRTSRYFFIRKDEQFVGCFLKVCDAIFSNTTVTEPLLCLDNDIPDFENLICLRQWASRLAKQCNEVRF